jgi:hypothetical protein
MNNCTSCGEERDDVERRYSFGFYAGRLCEDCCLHYRDHCGIDQPQALSRIYTSLNTADMMLYMVKETGDYV